MDGLWQDRADQQTRSAVRSPLLAVASKGRLDYWPNASDCAFQQFVCNHGVSRHCANNERVTLMTMAV